jgi:iron-sulfur cluster repair protein YtfE (RIC family)
MEAFHATFQGALNDEFEALVRDLRAAAGAVADAADSSGASVDPDAWLSKRALVGELVARWTFLIATYRAHVAAEDEVVLPAVAARVSNVAHAYELEHEAEDELFESITAALDDANRSVETLCATSTTSGEPSSEHVGARERLRAAVQRAARIAHATKTVLQQHLAKEAAHLVPLLNDNFTQEEQADLVERFIASVPSGWVGPVLERGPTRGERGPLRTLLASWLARNRGGGKANETTSPAEKTDLAGVSKRARKTNDRSSRGKPLTVTNGDDDTNTTETDLTTKKKSPIDHIFQFHAALRSELLTLEADVLALPPPEKPSARVDALRGLEGRFVFFWGVYRAHSRSEDELVFPALEDKDELHNVSHSYTLDHEHEAELFVDLDACLRDLRVAAGIGDAEDARTSALVSPLNEHMEPRVSKAAVNDVERRLQAACAAVRVCLETHVAREEAELWPLFEKHFSETEQRRLVGLIIGRTGAEVLQSMLSWQRKALSENEKAAMIGRLRDASKNTRFASWLDTWWSGEDRAEGREKEGAGSDFGAEGEPEEKRGALDDERTSAAAKADAAMEGLKHVQEYLKDRQQSSQKTSASSAAKAAAAAAAAAAAVDKTGYTPSWDDMFRMNRQQLEASARTLSRDDSLAPERKAYLMQHLLAARWICAQQRNKKNKEDGRAAAERDGGEFGDRDRDSDPRASFGGDGVSGKRARDGANDATRVSDGSELPFRKGKAARVSEKTEKKRPSRAVRFNGRSTGVRRRGFGVGGDGRRRVVSPRAIHKPRGGAPGRRVVRAHPGISVERARVQALLSRRSAGGGVLRRRARLPLLPRRGGGPHYRPLRDEGDGVHALRRASAVVGDVPRVRRRACQVLLLGVQLLGRRRGCVPLPVLQRVPAGQRAGEGLLPLHAVQLVRLAHHGAARLRARRQKRRRRRGRRLRHGERLPGVQGLPVELGHARQGDALRAHDAHAMLRGVHQALLHVPALPQVPRGLLGVLPHAGRHLSGGARGERKSRAERRKRRRLENHAARRV